MYKLVAREKDGEFVPVIKISGNPEKVTSPGRKDVYRIVNRETGIAEGDYMTLVEEGPMDTEEPLRLFDPVHHYIQKVVRLYDAVPLLVTIFQDGALVYELPSLKTSAAITANS